MMPVALTFWTEIVTYSVLGILPELSKLGVRRKDIRRELTGSGSDKLEKIIKLFNYFGHFRALLSYTEN